MTVMSKGSKVNALKLDFMEGVLIKLFSHTATVLL